MKNLLFVCSGNTCRSPMAELYFNFRCTELGLRSVHASSAGVAALPGCAISEPARLLLAELGIDAHRFRSRAVSPDLLANADLVVAMTESHRRTLRSAFPDLLPECRLLLEFSGSPDSVPDPFGSSVARYGDVFAQMRPALDSLLYFFSQEKK